MRYGWDGAKRRRNIRTHKVDFAAVKDFEWETAVLSIDDREDYGELRQQAIGFIGIRLYFLVYTDRIDENGELKWIISVRRAQNREKRVYERETKR